MAADAARLCDAIGVGPAHVMGFSMGGAIAQELAIARADLTRSLVIVGSWAYSDRLFRTFVESSAYFAGLADDDRKFTMFFLGATYSRAVFEDGRVDAFCDAVLNNPHPQSLDAFQRTGRAILGHDTRDRLSAITVPTLVLHGEEDVICPPRHSREIARLIPAPAGSGCPSRPTNPSRKTRRRSTRPCWSSGRHSEPAVATTPASDSAI